MKVLALTGGIASGKSTVSEMFQQWGAAIIDADHLAHKTYEPGTLLYKILLNRLGPEILSATGSIDRKKLAPLLFNDELLRRGLEKLIHPEVRTLILQEIEQLRSHSPQLILVEAALHVETGYYREFDGLILVTCPKELQIERLRKRDSLSEEQIKARLHSQWPLEAKIPVANYLIDNSGSLENTQKQAKALFDQWLLDKKQSG